MRELIEPRGGTIETLAGVQRPRSYTSYAMTQFAYAPALAPQPGAACPMGVVTPPEQDGRLVGHGLDATREFFLPL